MKKLISGLFLGLFLISITVWAAPGDICGSIYTTDIICYINGVEVPSYNIGGRTVVIAEEITERAYYNNDLRTLIIGGLSPDTLILGQSKKDVKPGRKVGNIYETDIRTYIYNKELSPYSLDGRMAVAIEELGDDNTFSDIGGKYIWDPDARTINLTFMYQDFQVELRELMQDKHVNLTLNDDYHISFVSEPIANGIISGYKIPEGDTPQPLTLNGEVVGYLCYPTNINFFEEENKVSLIQEKGTTFFYFDNIEFIKAYLTDVEPVQPTFDDWRRYYTSQMCAIIDSCETEEYIFLYMIQPNPHGSSQFLRRIAKDGTQIYYDGKFKSVSLYGNMYFDNVAIDKENETVTFRYDTDYVIDLSTGEITPK